MGAWLTWCSGGHHQLIYSVKTLSARSTSTSTLIAKRLVGRPMSTTRSSSPVASPATSLAKIGAICASSELQLIIVTNDQEVVLGCREEPYEPQLCLAPRSR